MEDRITAWVARNKSGTISFFKTKPIKEINDGLWVCYDGNVTRILDNEFLFDFSQVKWEDEEPTKVELTIKICR